MTTYDILREFADSWVLLSFTVFFIIMLGFVFRKGTKSQYEQVSLIPLQDDEKV
jgi:cytochrome c oxidase cbb3-type subunit IV